ncbi:unnamed protein product [Pleuronectes platessa]|uniref:Uncharacterized protein n=1 Tax=Pleuronectes platessa TaxID=8262 RepID=A0A9N7U6Y0_PLEPL|nr:unnamed protein product [Pleuronectes platessa]
MVVRVKPLPHPSSPPTRDVVQKVLAVKSEPPPTCSELRDARRQLCYQSVVIKPVNHHGSSVIRHTPPDYRDCTCCRCRSHTGLDSEDLNLPASEHLLTCHLPCLCAVCV